MHSQPMEGIGWTGSADQLWWEGDPVDEGTKTHAAVQFRIADVDRRHGGWALPRVSWALQGWRKRAPRQTRPSFPWAVLLLTIVQLLGAGQVEAAIMVLVMG